MAGIDLSQFHAVFFEESLEWLDVLETQLLEAEHADAEQINLMFRAAHSIKGGAATFGFSSVANVMHEAETLMDGWRNGQRQPSEALVRTLLKAVDICRTLVGKLQNAEPVCDQDSADIVTELQQFSDDPDNASQSLEPEPDTQTSETKERIWQIELKPTLDLLMSGNDPLKLFSVLADFGPISGKVDFDQIPDADFDPTECYLSFQVELVANASKDEIAEIFEWLDDDVGVTIDEKIAANNAQPSTIEAVLNEPPAQAASPTSKKPVEQPDKTSKAATSIRVSTDKLDQLINLVGELVITQSMLGELGRELEGFVGERMQTGLEQLEQNTRELQESVMRVRMLPISFAFSRYPRMVHDLSNQLGKQIELIIEGEATEIDKTLLEKITDPLTHMVRNAVDHGIEKPEKRIQNGKSEVGRLTLRAYHQGGNVVIEVADDGGGVDPEIVERKAIERGLISENHGLEPAQLQALIFEAGFSTAEVVSDVSGRGVGMDVVKKNIQQLGGQLALKSVVGEGSTIAVTLPLTLSILDGQLVSIDNDIYVIPLLSIVESIQLKASQLRHLDSGQQVFRLRDEHIPMFGLAELLHVDSVQLNVSDGIVVVLDSPNGRFGLLVGELLSQQQVVIKSLEDNYQRVMGLSGATILGNGHVAMILDPAGLAQSARGGVV
ncbi:chemotaxis protein CheA [Salinibius halmophilus]|uniref:chemotaxis protein CheA n=1 Tax=Salinibius halmophilus TaxID=1853216 RepID=UPI000E66F879|nr:chemotaxis protein CheA [Salinibius halmophilus]